MHDRQPRLELDVRTGREVVALVEHGADLGIGDLGIDVGVGAGRLDDGDLGWNGGAAVGGTPRCSGRMP